MTRRSSKSATVKRTGVKQGLPYDTLGLDAESLKKAMLGHLEFTLAELPRHVDSEWEPYVALALAVRDRMIERWLRTQDTYYEQRRQARLLPVARVPDGPHARQQPRQPGPARRVRARRCSELGLRPRGICARRSGTRASATAAWAGSPPASSTRWPRSATRPTATASATSTASSTSGSSTAPRSRCPDDWLRYGNPWEIARDRATRFRVQFGGRVEHVDRRRAASSRTSGSTRDDVLAMPYDMPIPGYGDEHRQHAAALGRQGDRASSTSTSSTRATTSAPSRSKSAVGEHLPGPLPERQRRRRARSCGSTQEYFFVARHAPGHRPPLQEALPDVRRAARPRRLRPLRRQGRHPAQRHAPGARHPRADARPGRRRGARAGTRPGRSPRATFGYTNHTSCPRRSSAGRSSLLERVLPRHLQIIYEINRPLPRRGAAALRPGDDERVRADVDHRGGRRAARAHGAPGHRRQPLASTAWPRCTPSS